MSADGYLVFLPANHIQELCMHPRTEVSFGHMVEQYFSTRYTGFGANNATFLKGTKLGIVSNGSAFIPAMFDEAESCISRIFGAPCPDDDGYVHVNVTYAAGQTTAQIMARSFVGKGLSRSGDWVDGQLAYLSFVWAAARGIQAWPMWLQPLVYRFVKGYRDLREEERRIADRLRPDFDAARLGLAGKGIEHTMIDDFLSVTPPANREDVMFHMTLQYQLIFTAIHPTSETLSTGLSIPAGCQVSYMTDAVNRDPKRWSDPFEFDPLRFYKLRNSLDEESQKTKLNYSYSGPDQLNFGYGVQACCGRVYAGWTIKMVIAELVLKYDLKLSEGPGTGDVNRNFTVRSQRIGNPKATILARRRAV
ncbi:hypothetical protein MCOR25_009703 [Pyricularia grisea]|nr:hypothetical protein MCOR25_009703 [Pyricularia grisea]